MKTLQIEHDVTNNMTETMEQSPSVLDGYLQFLRALEGGMLDAKLREQIALTVAQAALCEYSLAQHTFQARELGLTEEEIMANRGARSADSKTAAALKFARDLVAGGSAYSTLEITREGYSGPEILEIVANVGLNVFENYFNLVAKTAVDFPQVALRLQAA